MDCLTAQDIIAIIKTAADSGVETLEMASLKVKFRNLKQIVNETPFVPSEQASSESEQEDTVSQQKILEELQQELLHTLDPAEFENKVFGVHING